MEHAKKMVIIPAEEINHIKNQQHAIGNPSESNSEMVKRDGYKTTQKKEKTHERIDRILKIALALAKINAYDGNGRIRSGDTYLENTNIVQLINHALRPQKVLVGEQEFIQLLLEADLEPSLVLNENMRNKLSVLPKNEKTINVREIKDENKKNYIRNATEQNISVKRPAEESENRPLKKKKLTNWTIPESDDEE